MDLHVTEYTNQDRVIIIQMTTDEAEAICDELWTRVVLADSAALGPLYRTLHASTHPGLAP